MNRNTKAALIIGAVILALLIAMPMIWGGPMGWSDGSWHMTGPWMMGSGGWGWFMPLFMLIFLGLIIWAIVAVVRGVGQFGGSYNGRNRADPALEVLKARYAKGEISQEEFEQIRKNLS
ncbi:MAG: SHOCT domain-containing protein [Dehalococcoidia bacterium]|nr:SHOCT domain-containing protein [Dehalococcoidia bacterium]